jgi:hypothetical protein
MRKRLGRLLVVATLVLGTFAAFTPAASAVDISCTIDPGENFCQTAIAYANPSTRSIYIGARTWNVYNWVTCRAIDADTGAEVGRVSANLYPRGRTIPGLYGRYFMDCHGAPVAQGFIRV